MNYSKPIQVTTFSVVGILKNLQLTKNFEKFFFLRENNNEAYYFINKDTRQIYCFIYSNISGCVSPHYNLPQKTPSCSIVFTYYNTDFDSILELKSIVDKTKSFYHTAKGKEFFVERFFQDKKYSRQVFRYFV